MHSSKVGWAGQAFALASSGDSGGRKSRIRRSKEERKSMVESFIQKYQRLNHGNFPSLNLTHKEVGGSFYTVREIVREIIQENRVLAPPKVSSEEHSLSGFLEQHPLGSISMEPLIDLSVSDRVDGSTGRKLADQGGGSDGTSESHHVPNHYQDPPNQEVSNSPQSESHKFEENIVNGCEVVSGSRHFDKSFSTSDERGSQMLSNQHQTVDKANEFEQRIYTDPAALETLDRAKFEAQNGETSPAIKSHKNSDLVVETFPLRAVPRTINNMFEETSELQEPDEKLDDKGIKLDKKTFVQSSSTFASEEGDKKLPLSTVELNVENGVDKVVLNLQDPLVETEKHLSASKISVLDVGDIPELESKVSLPNRVKGSNSSESLILEDSTTRGASCDGENSSVAKGNNPTLDRINLETWDSVAKKSIQHESNPFMAFVKTIISSFVKFWTE